MEILSTIITEGYSLEINQEEHSSGIRIILIKKTGGVTFKEDYRFETSREYVILDRKDISDRLNDIVTGLMERMKINIALYNGTRR